MAVDMTDGGSYHHSKKTDEICDGIRAEESSRARLRLVTKVQRLRLVTKVQRLCCCMLRGIDIRSVLFVLIILPSIIVGGLWHYQKITYFLRPLWESPPKPFDVIRHYYYENASAGELCKLHGWTPRSTPRRVFDAVPFSNEVDMLEIRWRELQPHITKFIILESNTTFTGHPKPLYFASSKNQERFRFAQNKYHYASYGGRHAAGAHPFVEEAFQRVALDRLIKTSGIREGDLLIMSDVDEIPSAHTINVLRWCDGIPGVVHLQMRDYLYSYEFLQGYDSWRASVHVYKRAETRYGHHRASDLLLADSGWHCSFCFRRISDFVFKMKAYSHSDRVRFSYFLDPPRIQHIICSGSDLFDMLPEEHTFQRMIAKLGPIPRSFSAVHLPAHVLRNPHRFSFLLPGNCMRAD